MLSAVIATIGRATLPAAVASCVREGVPVVVVSDGFDIDHSGLSLPNVEVYQLGRNYGRLGGNMYYGNVAFNTGMLLAKTEFAIMLGDDDELMEGAGDCIRAKITEQPDVDFWIPGLRYNDGGELCIEPVFQLGNVSHPIFRTTIPAYVPFHNVDNINQSISDYLHMEKCIAAGYRYGFIGRACISIRPQLPNRQGEGT